MQAVFGAMQQIRGTVLEGVPTRGISATTKHSPRVRRRRRQHLDVARQREIGFPWRWEQQAATSPGLIFYLAGADPHEGDRLGRLKLTAAGLAERDRRVFAAARERRIRLAVSMAGGYGGVIEETVRVQMRTVEQAWAAWREWNNAAA